MTVMSRGPFVPLSPFSCSKCGKQLGWTSPGEAKRMNQRAKIFCDDDRTTITELTPRQVEYLAAARSLRAAGEAVTFGTVAAKLGVSRSRSSQIALAIRARGYGRDLDAVFGGRDDAPVTPTPVTPTAAGMPVQPPSTHAPAPTPVSSPTPSNPVPPAIFSVPGGPRNPDDEPTGAASLPDDAFVT